MKLKVSTTAILTATLLLTLTLAATPAYAALSITLDKTTYNAGQQLSLTGSGATPNQPVSIQVLDPNGSLKAVAQVESDAYGTFTASNIYMLPTTPTGTWSVKASSGGSSVTLTFTLAPAGRPLVVATPNLKDFAGNIVTSPKAGSMLTVASSVKNTQSSAQPALYIVQVKDSSGVVVHLSYITGSIPASSELEFGVGWTPTAAGVYTIQVFAWDNFTNASPQAAMQTITVTVS